MRTLEIAVFDVKNPDTFALEQARLHAHFGELFEGCVGSMGLRSETEPGLFADLVLWESGAHAGAAAAALGELDELSWFRDALGDIRFFDHLEPAADWSALAAVASAPVVEIVLLNPADADAFTVAHDELHGQHLEAAPSVVSHVRLEMNANGVAGDVNGWSSADAMAAMGSAMMERSELAPIFDPRNEMLLFMPFTTNVAP